MLRLSCPLCTHSLHPRPPHRPSLCLQVSGLKSITAKHLALSCQCLDAFMALFPALVALFTQGLLPPRRDMLVADFGRALQASKAAAAAVEMLLVVVVVAACPLFLSWLACSAQGEGGHQVICWWPTLDRAAAGKQGQARTQSCSPFRLPF